MAEEGQGESDQKGGQSPQPDRLMARENFERAIGTVLMFLGAHPLYEHFLLEDARDRIVPPMKFKQYCLVEDKAGNPIAFVSWARMNEDAKNRLLEAAASGQLALPASDWKSGRDAVIVDVACSVLGEEEKVCRKIKREIFAGEKLLLLGMPAEDGARKLIEINI